MDADCCVFVEACSYCTYCRSLLPYNDHVMQVKHRLTEEGAQPCCPHLAESIVQQRLQSGRRVFLAWEVFTRAVWDILSSWKLVNKVYTLMTKVLMVGDKLPDMWNRGDTESKSCMDRERESQPRKRLSHSIEEILRRPTCVRKEKRVPRNWSVIKENTRISNQLPCAGMFLSTYPCYPLLSLKYDKYKNNLC